MASLRIYRICGSNRNDSIRVIGERRHLIRGFLKKLDVSDLGDAGESFLNEVQRLVDVAYSVIDKEAVHLSPQASEASESEASSEYESDDSVVLVRGSRDLGKPSAEQEADALSCVLDSAGMIESEDSAAQRSGASAAASADADENASAASSRDDGSASETGDGSASETDDTSACETDDTSASETDDASERNSSDSEGSLSDSDDDDCDCNSSES